MQEDIRSASESAPLDWEAVRAYLAERGMTLELGTAPRQFAGGLANINYFIRLNGAPAVLRRPPGGELPPGSHDMAREHRIMRQLSTALPFIPKALLLCEDRSVIGVPFQLIEFRNGIVVRSKLPPAIAERSGAGERLTEVLVQTLAALHAIDPDAVGLGDLGKPKGFLGRAVAGWRKRAAAVEYGEAARLAAEVGPWLELHAVPDGAPALLHNDFKLDNMILDPADLSAVGVVDWDQGTRGDPLFDLGTTLSYWAQPGDPPAMLQMGQMPTAEPGFPTREEAVRRYAALTGRDVSDFRFFRVLGMFKTSVIFLQLGHRHRMGETDDPRYAGLSELGTGLMAFTHEIAQGRAF